MTCLVRMQCRLTGAMRQLAAHRALSSRGHAGAGTASGTVTSTGSNRRPGDPASGAAGSSLSRACKLPMRPLPLFVDDRFPGPEPRVSASLLGNAIDLNGLRTRLQELGCPTGMWQGQVLFCGSSEGLGQQQCSAVFLPDGCAVCWHMSRETEQFVLELASSSPAQRRRPTRLGVLEVVLEGSRSALEDSEPLATEELDVVDAVEGARTVLDPHDGSLRLTTCEETRASHQLGLSLGLAVAVRLDALETKIERRLQADWQDMRADVRLIVNLSGVSHRIFVEENVLHEMRNELNSEAGLLDAPDLLWEHALAERLYDQVVSHFDVRRRRALLNERLSYSLDYLHTLGEHVRHLYSVRLERMIIVLIALELGVGIMGLTHEYHRGEQDKRDWASASGCVRDAS